MTTDPEKRDEADQQKKVYNVVYKTDPEKDEADAEKWRILQAERLIEEAGLSPNDKDKPTEG